MSDIQKIL